MCPAALPGIMGNKPPPGSSADAAHTLGAQCPRLMPGVLNHQILLWSASHGKAFFQGRKYICYPNITSTYTNMPTHTGGGGRHGETQHTSVYTSRYMCIHAYKHISAHIQALVYTYSNKFSYTHSHTYIQETWHIHTSYTYACLCT